MIFTVDNEFHRFQIKRLQQVIEEQQAQEQAMRALQLTYTAVNEVWGGLLAEGIDDSTLYKYRCKLEVKLHGFD